MSAYGCVAPFASARSGYYGYAAVEFDSNVLRRSTLGIFLEYPDDDPGFGFVDLAQTWNAITALIISLLYTISISNAAGSLTLLDRRPHALAGTIAPLLDRFLTEDRADVHLDI
jgi:hypothetical protein